MLFLFVLPFVSFVITLFTSSFGGTGAFLLVPFQVSILGFTSPSVNATNLFYNLIATPSGVYRYAKEGRLVLPLAVIVVAGTMPGVFIGAMLRVTFFLDPRLFKFFVGLVLLYLGFFVLHSSLHPSVKIRELEEKFKEKVKNMRESSRYSVPSSAVVKTKKFSIWMVEYEFWGKTFSFLTLAIFMISFVIGIIGGIYGIVGGVILAPALAVFGLPVYTTAGATLLGTFLTSLFGVVSYTIIGYPPEWHIGILFGVGGLLGVYCGARLQKYMPERMIRFILSVIVLLTATNYIWQFFSV